MDTDPEVDGQQRVAIRSMTADEFEVWKVLAIQDFAAQIAESTGQPVDEALKRARKQLPVLLPKGMDTERTWLLIIVDDKGERAGTLWIGPNPDLPQLAYVFSIDIDEAARGRGLGRAAMVEAERLVGNAGISEIGLNVFGHNERARRLYDSLGYRVVATQMTKVL
jgi:ribosomal protein S18 acetylase RimI-like enzyme